MVRGGPLRAGFANTSALSLAAPANSPSTEKTGPTHSLGLHRAAGNGNVALLLYALENGQSPNSLLHGVAPLHVAACVGDLVATQLLIASGADVNLPRARSRAGAGPGVEGSTALHFAAANGHYAVVCILLENGARPRQCDRDGQTPEALALANQHLACAHLVRQCSEVHGADGHIEPRSVRELGYAVQWGDATLAPILREDSPESGRTVRTPSTSNAPGTTNTPALAPPALAGYWSKPVSVPLSIRTDVHDAPPPAPTHTDSPTLGETRRRTSLPFLLEKATHPASSLRALWPQGHAAPAIHQVLTEEGEDSSSGLRVPRISSRASLSGLLKRATGGGRPRTPDETATPPPKEDGEAPSRLSGVLSPTALLSLVQRRSHENLSASDASDAPSLSASPASDSTGRSVGRPRDTSRLRMRQLPPAADTASARASGTLALPTRTHRLRSSSASGAPPTQAWEGTNGAPGAAPATRARASSEVQPPVDVSALGVPGWLPSEPSSSDTSLRSTPPPRDVVRSILDQGAVLGAAQHEEGHSSLAILLAQYGESLQREGQ